MNRPFINLKKVASRYSLVQKLAIVFGLTGVAAWDSKHRTSVPTATTKPGDKCFRAEVSSIWQAKTIDGGAGMVKSAAGMVFVWEMPA
jgi:hypothetical protein